MPPAPTPIPSGELSTNSSRLNSLEGYLGKTVEDFCGKYGTVKDDINHCAHFVGHVLSLRIPGAALCSNVGGSKYTYEQRRNGYCVRVNQVFNSCTGRGYWTDATAKKDKCFVVATIKDNILSESPLTIGDMSRKHIGIYFNGMVYNYSNSEDRVVKKTIAEFRHHYGKGTILLKADLP